MSQAPIHEPRRYTVEEYFQIDSESEIRHEYVSGRIIDMAGGSDAHSKIIHNLHGVLWTRLRGSPCQARDGNLRVRYGRRVQYGYPDALIVCGQPLFDAKAGGNTTLLNPRVLIEVLSQDTEGYDRGRKFELYREIDSFEEYLLISRDRPSVEVLRRQARGFWMMQPYQGLDASAALLTVGIELPLGELFDGVELAPESPDEPDTAK